MKTLDNFREQIKIYDSIKFTNHNIFHFSFKSYKYGAITFSTGSKLSI